MSQSTMIESSKLELSPALKAANRDGMAWAVMTGCGENFFSVLGIFIKASPVQLSLLATLPQFIGALSQMAAVWTLKFMSSRRDAIISFVWLQALVWIPIALVPFMFDESSRAFWVLLGCVILYQAAGSFMNPLWSSLIGEMVPSEIRGRYFGLRNRLVGLYTFLGVFGAGQVLDVSKRLGDARYGFLSIFLVACVARLLTIVFLRRYENPPHEVRHEHHFSFTQFLLRAPRSNFARFVFFVSCVNFAVNISAPFFSLYMLRDLHFSYFEFTVITGTNTVTQFLTMQYWGKLSDQFGNKRILNVCGYGVALSPIMWIFGSSIGYLLVAQVFAGFVWAGFNLAAANFIYDAVTPPKRARCVAYQAMVNGALVLLGSVLGGVVVDYLPPSLTLFGWEWVPTSTLLFIFLLSGCVRIVAAILLLPAFREVREVARIGHGELVFRITNLRPITGATFSIVTDRFRRRR